METTTTPHELRDTGAPPGVDQGLRSAGGIRWLHWIGALVIGVSVVGLLASRWGELPRALQFLVLVTGAVGLQAAGDVSRHRLRLPATGSALYFLFTALTPLLAWGAAHLRLVEEPFGWLSVGLGLGVLAWTARRAVERVLDYRGWIYPAALGLTLLALPALAFADDHAGFDRRWLFVSAATALGLVLRFASRHVNRYFFHRDRVAGADRAVHFLPFALLALTYVAGMSVLSAFTTHLAIALVFLAVALVDTGEEYFQALVRATSTVPERWPRRSVGLLASGFALMAVAAAASFVDPTLRATALVSAVAALRLSVWALRYRRAPAYAFGLASALAAYHFSPTLVPAGVKELFWRLAEAVGIRAGSTAVISLADLGALAGLVVLAAVLRRRLTPAMLRVHAAVISFQGLVVLAAALPDPAAARILAPLAVLVLFAGLFALRGPQLVPVFYLAVAHAAVVWGVVALGGSFAAGWTAEASIVLAAVNLLFLAAGIALRRRCPRVFAEWAAWWTVPPLAGAAVVALAAFAWSQFPGLAWFLALAVVTALLLGGLLVRETKGSLAAALNEVSRHPRVWLGLPIAVTLAFPGGAAVGLALAAAALELARGWRAEPEDQHAGWWLQGWVGLAVAQAAVAGWLDVDSRFAAYALLAAAVAERVTAEALERRGRPWLSRPALPVAWVLASLAGTLAVAATASAHGSPWAPILPGFLASVYFLFAARDGGLRVLSSLASMGFFAVSLTVTFDHLADLGPELFWLGPGLALIGLSRLLAREIGERWSKRLFTAGAVSLYAMPVLGLLEELAWGWQIVMLLLSIAFGAASFRLRSRSLLTLSTAAAVIDLAFFLTKLGQTAPTLLWAVGIFFGLSLMGSAMMLEYRREVLLQKVRVWGREIRSWA